MSLIGSGFRFGWMRLAALALVAVVTGVGSVAQAADEPDLIFRRSTVFKWLSPNDKLATYGVDDPEVEGVACHFTVPERGGFKGWLGLAEEVSDISLACRQIGPIKFKNKSDQGEDMFACAARCSSRKCRSCVAATPRETCSSIWFIPTGSSRARQRTRPRQYRSCRGDRRIPTFRNAATSSSRVGRLRNDYLACNAACSRRRRSHDGDATTGPR